LIGLNSSAQDESLPVKNLKKLYENNRDFKKTADLMLENVKELQNGNQNPWKDKSVHDLYDFLNDWFYFLPNTHNGLDRILKFTFLYYNNPYGMKFVLSEPGLSWANSFIEESGKFMDSPESAKIIEDWLSDNTLINEDFV
jgi:phosphatidylserine decarboxylase